MDAIRNKATFFGLCGCGLVLGVSVVYCFYKTRRAFRDELSKEVNAIKLVMEQLRKEIEQIKIQNKNAPYRSEVKLMSNSAVDNFVQCNNETDFSLPSTEGSVDDNEEFFDFAENETSAPSVNCVLGNGIKKSSLKDLNLIKWLQDIDALLDDSSTNKVELYNKIRDCGNKFGSNADVLWRLAKATHLLSIVADKNGEKERKELLAFETLEHAKAALSKDDNNSECHKWYAIAIGSIGDYVSTKEKIQNGNEFKEHVDAALTLKPNDPTLHHMLGRWQFEIAKLTWVERKLASTLFSKVPDATYETALPSFLKAYELRPKWKENLLCISNTLIAMKKYDRAIKWIDEGIGLRVKGEDDQLAHDNLLTLQSKYASYRN